jgi:hypothetical protein
MTKTSDTKPSAEDLADYDMHTCQCSSCERVRENQRHTDSAEVLSKLEDDLYECNCANEKLSKAKEVLLAEVLEECKKIWFIYSDTRLSELEQIITSLKSKEGI